MLRQCGLREIISSILIKYKLRITLLTKLYFRQAQMKIIRNSIIIIPRVSLKA